MNTETTEKLLSLIIDPYTETTEKGSLSYNGHDLIGLRNAYKVYEINDKVLIDFEPEVTPWNGAHYQYFLDRTDL